MHTINERNAYIYLPAVVEDASDKCGGVSET
jgi:hypothetical protein